MLNIGYRSKCSCRFGFNEFGDNSVKGTSSFVSNDSGVDFEGISLLVFLDDFLFFELLQSPSDDFGTGVLMSFRSDFSSVKTSVNVGQKSNSSSWSDINFSGQ